MLLIHTRKPWFASALPNSRKFALWQYHAAAGNNRVQRRRNRGEGGIEQIGKTWYYAFYDLRGKHIRRSSKWELKIVAIEELRKAKEKLAKGIEPELSLGLKYDDIASFTSTTRSATAGSRKSTTSDKGYPSHAGSIRQRRVLKNFAEVVAQVAHLKTACKRLSGCSTAPY